jgi:hypothetical protein
MPWALPSIITRPLFFAVPGLRRGPRFPPLLSVLCLCFKGDLGEVTSQGQLCQLREYLHSGDSSEANIQFRKVEVVLVAKSCHGIVAFLYRYIIVRYTFMLPLEVVDPGSSLSMLLSPHRNG